MPTRAPPEIVPKQSPLLLWEVPTIQAMQITTLHCPPTPQTVSITPPLWEVPTKQTQWVIPTAALFPRPIEPHRDAERLQLGGQTLCWWDSQKGAVPNHHRGPKPKGRSRLKKGWRSPLPTFPTRHRPQGPRCFLTGRGLWGTGSVVSPATKPAGDRSQRLSTTKWWRPLSFSGTLEGSGQTEEILTSSLVNSSQKWYAFRKLNWNSHPNLKHTYVTTMTATTEP